MGRIQIIWVLYLLADLMAMSEYRAAYQVHENLSRRYRVYLYYQWHRINQNVCDKSVHQQVKDKDPNTEA